MRILEHYRAGGIARVLKHVAYYACTRSWVLWLADMQILGLVSSPTPESQQPLPGYSFRFASLVDLDLILACVALEERSQLDRLFRKFFDAGNRCAIALFESRVVGFVWAFIGEYSITLDDYRRTNLCVQLPPGAVFTGTAYVEPLHRGGGLYQRLKRYLISDYLRSTGFYASVGDLNVPSLAASRKLGFRTVATLRFIGVFSHTWLYIRAHEGHRWVLFRTRWSGLKLDGMHLRIAALDRLPATP